MSDSRSALIVTSVTEGFSALPPGFALARSATAALEWSDSGSFAAYFCDIAACDEGSNGYRLTRQLRRRGTVVPIYLLAIAPTPTIEMLAVASGASAVLPRSLAAILEAFHGLVPDNASSASGDIPDRAASMPAEVTPELADIANRAQRLLPAYVGPVASLMVADAVSRLRSSDGPDRGPASLASILSAHIADPAARKRFLSQLSHPQEPRQ